ncbi:hypothetical protein GPECTOR_6g661 [Gonium pectorale]|uniref:Guanylate cyclase domain-containing protein n=1 Tax=Gonium pectorale TaxID=33097 RepID=A0A150GVC2_GONPE|nr:hypothetical protein GPECTOR_6g661 [Gonium pectorale]|eukprot:KXZ53744.1 hypothetical protein GPECTOR_6g661 [Gonium pectorale]
MLTDVQGSTQLWESLPAVVMDTALSLHNDAFRQTLPRFHGYECHTEGDSFILAFHTAVEAAGFALEIQLVLLQLDWPQELLDHELCAMVRQAPPPAQDSNEGAAPALALSDAQQAGSNVALGAASSGGNPDDMMTTTGTVLGSGAGSAVPTRGPEFVDLGTAGSTLAEPWGLQVTMGP